VKGDDGLPRSDRSLSGDKEPTSLEETESVAVHEVPNEEAAMITVRALKERYGDQHLALGRCQQLKEHTHSDDGSNKKLAAANRGMTGSAIPAPRKGLGRQGPGRDSDARRAPKGRMFERRQQMWQYQMDRSECSNITVLMTNTKYCA
jgi:hypothetical protein